MKLSVPSPGPFRRSPLIAAATAAVLVPALIVGQHWVRGGFDPAPTRHLAGTGTQVVPVSLTDFNVEPTVLVAEPGVHVILLVTNDGSEDHDLAAEDGTFATRVLEPGESQRLDLGLVSPAEAVCTLPLHEFLGMEMQIRVERDS
jgi:hypothetical protein